MKISARGFELIKSFERYVSKPYLCAAGKSTIGFGHIILSQENYTFLTLKQAEDLLHQDLVLYEEVLTSKFESITLNNNQFDAMLSLSFNIGINAFLSSTLYKLVQLIRFNEAAQEFTRWVYCRGRILQGLVKRRKIEQSLFLSLVQWR